MNLLIARWLGVTLGLLAGQLVVAQDAEEEVRDLTVEVESDAAQEAAQEPSSVADPVPPPATEYAAQPGPQEVRLLLWDGTTVIGDLDISSLHMATRFGVLEVPVASIVRLTPGLNSLPDLRTRLEGLVEKLGDRDFKAREVALGELLAWGPPLLGYLAQTSDGGSAERKKHLQNLVAQLQADLDASGATGEPAAPPLVADDSLTTGEFTIVGQVQEQQFSVATRYGPLSIRLADIKSVDREWLNEASIVRRNFDVAGTSFFQTKPLSTGLRVRRGDRIRIRASGSVHWTNWGNISSGPAGIANHGQWQGFNCGMLLARVGQSGELSGIGDEGEFVARTDGELILGVAMQDNYANQQGYQWDGEYKIQLVVTSGE
jgi:hypothetical protein